MRGLAAFTPRPEHRPLCGFNSMLYYHGYVTCLSFALLTHVQWTSTCAHLDPTHVVPTPIHMHTWSAPLMPCVDPMVAANGAAPLQQTVRGLQLYTAGGPYADYLDYSEEVGP